MFEKVKGILAIEDELAKLLNQTAECNGAINTNNDKINSLHEQLALLYDKTSTIHSINKEISNALSNDILSIKNLRGDFERELAEFRMLRLNMEKAIAERVSSQVESGIREQVERLKMDVQQYNNLKKEFEIFKDTFKTINEEITKLKTISSSIKEKDFEMTKFANQLLQMDQHKLELMQKIETLERLISMERRRNPMQRR